MPGRVASKPPMAERFDFETLLGSGGYGDVFYAFDRLRGEHVAVKVMRRASPAHMRMLKREFRSLADVAYPNLVTLHELVSDGSDWCITMEFIDGVDLLRFSHGAVSPAAAGLASACSTAGRPASGSRVFCASRGWPRRWSARTSCR